MSWWYNCIIPSVLSVRVMVLSNAEVHLQTVANLFRRVMNTYMRHWLLRLLVTKNTKSPLCSQRAVLNKQFSLLSCYAMLLFPWYVSSFWRIITTWCEIYHIISSFHEPAVLSEVTSCLSWTRSACCQLLIANRPHKQLNCNFSPKSELELNQLSIDLGSHGYLESSIFMTFLSASWCV